MGDVVSRTTTCLPQEYLRSVDDGLHGLEVNYRIKHRRHPRYPHLVQLKYSQIDSPMGMHIVQQCRGIILDEANDWAIVARPFDKFFNHGETFAADIDWSTARVQEKLDGSLLIRYHYNGEWHWASSGTPDAGGPVGNGFDGTLAELATVAAIETLRAVNPHGSEAPNPRLTYLFELTSPHNRIVVPHAETRLTLLAVRSNETGEYLRETTPFPCVRSFPLQSMGDVLATFDAMSPLAQEGYVIVDGAFNRIKVKHPGYVAIHHAKDGLNDRALLDIVRSGEVSEVAATFPEIQASLDAVAAKYNALADALERDYAACVHGEGQKAFALSALPSRLSAALFAVRSGKVKSVREFLKNMPLNGLMERL